MNQVYRTVLFAAITAGVVFAAGGAANALCAAPVLLAPKGGVVQTFDASDEIRLRIAYSADAPDGKGPSDCPWRSTTWQVATDPSKFFDFDSHRFATSFDFADSINRKAGADLITQEHPRKGSGGGHFNLRLVAGQVDPGQRVYWRARINYAIRVSSTGVNGEFAPTQFFSSPFSEVASFEVSRVFRGK